MADQAVTRNKQLEPDFFLFRRINFEHAMQTVRWQRQDAGKRAGDGGDHHEQPHAKSADGCGEDKGRRERRRPAGRIAGWWSRYPCGQPGTLFCTTTVNAREKARRRQS